VIWWFNAGYFVLPVKGVRLSALFSWYNVEKPLCSLKQVLLLLVMNCLDELKISQLSLTYTTLMILWVV